MSLSLATKGRVSNLGKSYATLGVIYTIRTSLTNIYTSLDAILKKRKQLSVAIDAILSDIRRDGYLQFASSVKDEVITFAIRSFKLNSTKHSYQISSSERTLQEPDTSENELKFKSRIINKDIGTKE